MSSPQPEQQQRSHTSLADVMARILGASDQQAAKAGVVSAVSEGRRGKRPLPCEEEDGRRTLRKRSKKLLSQSGVVLVCHKDPQYSSVEDDRRLQRIATRGVVQLFNAVSKHQKKVEAEVKKVATSERKKAKVLAAVDKGSFIDMLKGSSAKTASQDKDTSTPSWSLLQGELTQKSKLKDWDRSSESDNRDPDNSDSDL